VECRKRVGRVAGAGDGVLRFRPGTAVKALHGFGFLGRHATLKP
jgi:hypothetical protein